MWTIAQVRRYINRVELGQLFTTRDFLSYGSRAAVDQALCRLVKSGYIERVARGVFVKASQAGQMIFSAMAVARVKAESFGKRIFSHAADAAQKLGLIPAGNRQPSFATNGRSSSFRFGDSVIHLRECSPKKMWLGDSNAGLVIRALWHLGQSRCNARAVMTASQCLGRFDRAELRQRAAFMPAWLNSYFLRRLGVSSLSGRKHRPDRER